MNSTPTADPDERADEDPRLLVFSSLFPNRKQPTAGIFIRERLSHVMEKLPAVVVAPVPWFPLQGLIRLFRAHYRPMPDYFEDQDGLQVYHPRFLAIPGLFRRLDGFSMAVCSLKTVRRLKKSHSCNIIDSHFAYPDGYAASLLARWVDLPFTVTLRGTEIRMSRDVKLIPRIRSTLENASSVIAVANSLRKVIDAVGAQPRKVTRVANGVDVNRFYPLERSDVRPGLGLSAEDIVLVSVGGLVPRKGFHRVIDVMPGLLQRFPGLKLIIVGGSSAEGDFGKELEQQVARLDLQSTVRFLGTMPPDELKYALSAANVFVLATENEGWANVFLEAMACGLPVVTTRVGGNAEVVSSEALGSLVEFGNSEDLQNAISEALERSWDRSFIRQHAEQNTWNLRVEQLCEIFAEALQYYRGTGKSIN